MRIEYIVQARMPTEKAHGLQIAHMCNAFAELGHEIHLVVPKRKRVIADDVFMYYDVPARFSVRYLWSPDLVSSYGYVGPIVHWAHSFLFVVRLLAYRPVKSSIIYTRSPEIAWLYKLRGYTVVCEVHDWPESFQSLFARLLQRVDLLPCNSPGTERACRAHGLSRTMVAHNGIDAAAFTKMFDRTAVRDTLGVPQDKKIVMYIGALEKWKGVETLCDAAALFPPDVCAVVIGGRTEEVAVLQKQYPQVYFLGVRPYRELAMNQSAADVLVVPNIPETQESSEFTSPIKLFAHLASGIPIVISDIVSLRAIVDDTSVLFFEAANPVSLAQAVTSALATYDRSAKRAVHAQEVVRAYTWQSRAQSIIACLDNRAA